MEKFIKAITKRAGALVHKQFGKIGVKYHKSDELDVVTQADLDSNRFLIKAIKQKFPEHGIISEEFPEIKKKPSFEICSNSEVNTSKGLFTISANTSIRNQSPIQAANQSKPMNSTTRSKTTM
jgi:3'-phosphoadenosine 5'-phosphosulfate (PAPS) 3'-phosphatase